MSKKEIPGRRAGFAIISRAGVVFEVFEAENMLPFNWFTWNGHVHAESKAQVRTQVFVWARLILLLYELVMKILTRTIGA